MPEGLFFEHTMRSLLGDKVDGSAGYNAKEQKKIIIEFLNVIEKEILELETTLRHKKSILNEVESLKERINIKNESNWQNLFFVVLRLCIRLMGFKIYNKPIKIYSLSYSQNQDQLYTEQMLNNNEENLLIKDKNNTIAIQSELAKQLKNEGYPTYKIAQVLNLKVNKVKELLKL